MLNIAPLDYERYAALYGPSQMPVTAQTEITPSQRSIEEIDRANPARGRLDSSARENVKDPELLPGNLQQAQRERDPEHPLNGPFPTDLWGSYGIPVEILNATQTQLGPTSEKVAEIYGAQRKEITGTLRISA